MNRLRKLKLILLCASTFYLAAGVSNEASSSVLGFTKGCAIMAGIGAGGAALAASVSSGSPSINDQSALAAAAAISCLVGGLLNNDVEEHAEIMASGELLLDNIRLKNAILSTMHDLCVMKKTCDSSGETTPNTKKSQTSIEYFRPEGAKSLRSINSGN